jgi:hypothetical protein
LVVSHGPRRLQYVLCMTGRQPAHPASAAPPPLRPMLPEAHERIARVLGESHRSAEGAPDLTGLADALLEALSFPDTAGELLERAIAHDEHRREYGHDADVLLEDYVQLRRALREALPGVPHQADADLQLVERFDAWTTLATRASLVGHSRPALERAGRWERARAELLGEPTL